MLGRVRRTRRCPVRDKEKEEEEEEKQEEGQRRGRVV